MNIMISYRRLVRTFLGLGEEWSCVFANDFSEQKAKSYRTNWGDDHLIVEDINKIVTTALPGHADLAWASFPCQDLSLAGNGAGLSLKSISSPRTKKAAHRAAFIFIAGRKLIHNGFSKSHKMKNDTEPMMAGR